MSLAAPKRWSAYSEGATAIECKWLMRIGEGIYCEARVVALGWSRDLPLAGKAVVEKLLLVVPLFVVGSDCV